MSMGWCPRCVCARIHPDTNLLLNKISQLRSSVDGILVTLSSAWSSKLLETWCGGRSNFCSMNKSSGNNGPQNKRKTKIKTLSHFDIYGESTRRVRLCDLFFRKTNLSLFSFTLQVAQLVYIPQTTIGMPAHIKRMPWKFHIRGICFTIFRKRTYPLGIKLSLHLAKETCRRRWYCQAAGCSKSGVTISSDTLMCRHITGYPQPICSQMTTFENTSRKRLITLIITVNKSQL